MLGVGAAIVFSCLLGMVWYSHRLPMGRVWMHRTYPGKSAEEIGRMIHGPAMGVALASNTFTCFILRLILVNFFNVKVVYDAVKFAVGLACMATFLEFPHLLFSRRSVDAFIVDQIYNLLVMVAASVSIFYFG